MNFWHICFLNGKKNTYKENNLNIVTSCLCNNNAKNCLDYLREIASINELKSSDGEVLLKKQYEKLDFVSTSTALALYLAPAQYEPLKYQKLDLIFPFGGNASQFKAVEAAMTNQISVIQGPPGTGKTQTILNIIANLLMAGKTVQIVSNNNSAIRNVLEKLDSSKYNMGFLIAFLGNTDNIATFIENQTGEYPNLRTWQTDQKKQTELLQKINILTKKVVATFAKQEKLAQRKLELDSLLLEIQYFEQYCNKTMFERSNEQPKRLIKSDKLMELWLECYNFSEKERSVSFWFKIRSSFIYRIAEWKFYKNSLPTIVTHLQNLFYQSLKTELNEEITALKNYIDANDNTRTMNELTNISLDYLRTKLFERYGKKTVRKRFTNDDRWKHVNEIVTEYPIILSTTFSARSCLSGITYDYLIIDEASQVDIATGALALSGAKNAVIVGDLKQLPNVVKNNIKECCSAIFDRYKLHQGYNFSENSFLKSVCSIIPNIKQTLLREHYRCHPKIIGFCNKKFYNNELIIMTEDHKEPDTLSIFKTNIGNHKRNRINQRQIDVAIQEALPIFKDDLPEEIGIIAPYKDQVEAISKQLNNIKIEVHTVHKFQGREKDTIVLTTVDDVVTDFSDDPYLLNVAVSRAKKKLSLIISGNSQPYDSNISDLIDYIEYNNFTITESKLYSVFDMLYQQYTNKRIAFLKKHPRVSAYDSENLMYSAIMELLNNYPKLSLNVICHQPLNMLISDTIHLNDKERNFVTNTATHLDFLIYNNITKKPVVAIEVDGFHYHKQGTVQYERDRMKDRILQLYNIDLLRFSTSGSGELKIIEQALNKYARQK